MSYMAEANAIAATPRNMDVLAYAREFFAANDQLPTIKCIRDHFGWTSDNAADAHVQALIRHGKLERNVLGKLRFAREKGSAQ